MRVSYLTSVGYFGILHIQQGYLLPTRYIKNDLDNKKVQQSKKREKKQKLKNNTNISYFRCYICKSKLDTKFPVPVPTARFEEF